MGSPKKGSALICCKHYLLLDYDSKILKVSVLLESDMELFLLMQDVQWRSQELYGGVSGRTGGCGRGLRPLEVQLGGMGERCKLPHRGLGLRPRSFATLSL